MATPNPAQQIAEDIRSLQSKVGSLQESARLSKARDAVEDLQSSVKQLSTRIMAIRKNGYLFEKGLENQEKNLSNAWTQLYPSIQSQINLQSSGLVNSMRSIEMQMTQLNIASRNPISARGLLGTLQSSVRMVEDKVTAIEKTIAGMYDNYQSQVQQFIHHLGEIEYLQKQLAEASFQLFPTEGGISAVKAVWCKGGKEQKDDPEGVLILTDQRILFEQKEEVVTKKVLFVATEKQKLQQLLFESPVQLVEKIDTSKQGLLKNEDHLEIHYASGAPAPTAHFHIWEDVATWQQLINRSKIKDFDLDRITAVDPEVLNKVKSAPSQCPNCGGNITQVVMRGMDSIKCEYCGFTIRL